MSVWGPTSPAAMKAAIEAVDRGSADKRQVDVVRDHADQTGDSKARAAIDKWDRAH